METANKTRESQITSVHDVYANSVYKRVSGVHRNRLPSYRFFNKHH